MRHKRPNEVHEFLKAATVWIAIVAVCLTVLALVLGLVWLLDEFAV